MPESLPLLLSDSVVGLRRPEPCDASSYLKLRNDLATVAQLIAYHRGVSLSKINEWILDAAENQRELVFTAVTADAAQRPVGFIKAFDFDTTAGCCRLGLALFDVGADGKKGYGGRILGLLLGYLADWLRIRKVTLEVLDDNLPAVQLYRRHGFVEEGRLQDQYFIAGRYRSVILLSKFMPRKEAL